ncbi:MAG: collagen-like protein, partial [Crocinitomicaceae bacterium]|nr:collagen-like protein [Crocinitomicaceae bacterium]
MKKILLSLVAAATLSFSSFGQAPEGFKYQAVVRDAGNAIINNQAVGIRMTIFQGSVGGTTVYSETFATNTNAYGLVSIQIGNGTVLSGTFGNIDWANGPFVMETAIDVSGGTNYSVMGSSQLLSVPYALYAKTSGNGQGPAGPQGIQGPAGVDGTNGTNGIDGVDGVDGATGPQGPIGVDGTNGTNGTNGIDGAAGPQGNQGLPGTNGADGATGPQGNQGLPGTNGADGAQGNQGLPGTNGAVGATGAQGPAGADGQGGVTTAGSGINVTGAGTAASPYLVSATSPCGLAIGQTYQGGIIFYLDASGCHGLISAPTDQITGIQWYNGSYTDTYASGSGLFDGDGNCYRIRRSQGDCANCNAA